MAKTLKTGDNVTVISGNHKGQSAKIVKVLKSKHQALLEGIGTRTRKLKPSHLNPKGGKKEIHTGIDLSNLRKIKEKK